MAGLGIVTLITLFGGYGLLDAPAIPIREVGVDVFAPLDADRDIHTIQLDAMLREKSLADGRLTLRLGATGSVAAGRIRVPEAGAFVVRDSDAAGLGLSIEARWRLLSWQGVALNADLAATPMLYDRPFPAGGTHYGGMFRAGFSMHRAFGDGSTIGLGLRWMHFSNGRGIGPDNPAYEGAGLELRYSHPF